MDGLLPLLVLLVGSAVGNKLYFISQNQPSLKQENVQRKPVEKFEFRIKDPSAGTYFRKPLHSLLQIKKQDVICLDGEHQCQEGETCCKGLEGTWACCQSKNAVCCDDHLHCCPQGMNCDNKNKKCVMGSLRIDWIMKHSSKKSEAVTTDKNVCPDNSSECLSTSTCCQLAIGKWGCCDVERGVCCDDHVHCCPEGFRCEVKQQKCVKGNVILDMLHNTPAGKTNQPISGPEVTQYSSVLDTDLQNVICPDGEHECPSGNSCCQLASGDWGCCPLEKAVCCSDHLHCCPHGTKCDVSEGKCIQGNIVTDWFEKTPALRKDKLSVGSVVCPDGEHECPDGNTCCKLASGDWGCCPLAKAVCCSDHLHCCPHGTKCDVSEGKCIQGDIVTNWFEKTPALKKGDSSVGSVVCPDGEHECPDGNTCCKLASGDWGCCPLAKAVCCSDHLHCCPHGTKCDVSEGKCIQGNIVTDWFEKTPALRKDKLSVGSVVCPDGEHECPDGNTCCKLASGDWGCCPLAKAVCCSDNLHCCPHGTKCDVAEGKCIQGDIVTNWFEKTPALKKGDSSVGSVVCPDGEHECPDGNTCCKLASGDWGCCPLAKAVCCSDHLHCCPHGTKCDVSEGKCIQGNIVTDWFEKTPALRKDKLSVGSVVCPDGEHECPDGNTCCKLASGDWGCCPLVKAVCCSDHLHCCPHGTKCDVSEGKCIQGNVVTDWFEKTPALRKDKLSVGSVVCPDGEHECPDGNTCCKLASGDWGCCPLAKAVCCSDHLHCCPHGTKCDVSEGKCIQGDIVTNWFEKTPALKKGDSSVGSVVCPDGEHECPDGKTCCKLASGDWGCCPLAKAVCCSDHLHCCPHGTKCDVSEGKCIQGNVVTDWFEKTPALRKDKLSVGSVVCPDGEHECPDGNTCCKLASGDWGCCPLAKAVCCSDHLHCCPHGTKCDVSEGKCIQGNVVTDWFEKTPALRKDKLSVGSVVCPDGEHECPDGNTCCKLASGDWGCCPLAKAVCCSDHLHCCPHGTKCDVSEGKCIQGDIVSNWFEKTPALKKGDSSVGSVVCPDGEHECPDGNTCCKLASGDWGCCPLAKAVCCSDHLHCCPHGTKCDVSEGKCIQGNVVTDWFEKTPALRKDKLSVGSVVCPDGEHECPDGNTCCKLASGDWGCCPLAKAVCCSDHLHCCPHGTKCDVAEGKCIQGDIVTNWFEKTPALKKGDSSVGSVVCPDGEHECPDGNTCCKLASGDWGCCPLAKAVCCSDHLHCCPHGTKCDVSEGKCIQGNVVTDWFEKTPALRKDKLSVGSVVCPDGEHECPDGNTCCKLASGDWGCCPLAKAVCCSDHLHCCPHGTKCDVSEGKCIQGNIVTDWFEKTPALKKGDSSVGSVVCPDGEHECPDGNTCCKLASGDWGCCPLAKAVCCSDHLHCCPHGTKCDVSEGKCIQGDIVTNWFEKTPASKKGYSFVGSVVCPDGEHECPDGNTCCKLASGDWGCCPLAKAVCCSDHLHCCPHGTKCDVSEGKCIQGNIVTDWFEKTPALRKDKLSVGSVVCPDGEHECPDGNTCCKLASGDWGCCPLAKAVCCSDHLHCCPRGTKCDVSEGKCIQGDIVTNWFEKTPALKKGDSSVWSVVCPDGEHECPDGNTCCKLASGDWGCCPLAKAVCCSDHLHCCPHGTKCDVSEGKCIQGNIVTDWFEKTPALRKDNLSVGSVVCPDGEHECPDGNTCCKLASGDWGCCPLAKAVCCSDHLHCCPHGTKCDVSEGKCIQGDIVTNWFEKTPALRKDKLSVGSVVCPDGEHECPDGNTCCKLASGDWGCCPLAKAVCCSDHLHCCPHGTKCDVSEGKCIQGNVVTDWFEKTPALRKDKLSVGSVVCPDGEHECPDGNTCCKLASGDWGCCPLAKAVCCSDHLHCCPHGTKCDVSEGKCIQGNVVTDWFEKTPALRKDKLSVGSVVCPDGEHECPDGNTCCKLASGDWGCCPLAKAVCCSDHLHCCPHGTKCDVAEGKCIQGDIVTNWFEKTPALKKGDSSVGSVVCPDGEHECPDGNTCCKLASGDWGCCPLAKAVCCSDHLHCCPHGTKCDVSEGKCIQGNVVTDWFEKTPALRKDKLSVGSVVCPDGEHECPDGNTCCKLASGDWGCCPLAKAVCCSDHLHCCPHGTKCDVSEGKCIQGNIVTDWFEKTPALRKDKLSVGSVVCPDGEHECPDGNTCCKLASGDWGCCPLAKAVCCSDHLHCCPHGTKCDVAEGKCIQGDIVTNWFEKTPALKKGDSSVGSVVCPDGEHECPDGNTCCKLASGDWGCCPLAKAVCCSDHLHCCPHGTKCDVSEGKCIQGNIVTDWFEKTPALRKDNLSVGSVVCPDGEHECPDGNTCCKLASGDWGCCPLAKAVCCSDHLHCCPHGTKCDVSEGKCIQGNVVTDWFEKTPALRKDKLSVGSVVCPDGEHECPDGNTCCKLASGDWGCCPLAKAVCCSDHLHCCPHGTKCDVAEGKCIQGDIVTNWFEKTPALKKGDSSVGSVVCPDGEHECPDGNTCCKLASGDWGCCPLAKAVCCSDHLHCCPHGTKCDVSEGKCIQGNVVTDWFEKTPALRKDKLSVGSVVCPDGEHECPDGNTCCKLASGDWGCCPLAKAVCCSDHLHCCPHGTKCDVSEGKCIQGNIVTDWFEKTPALRKDKLSVGSVVCPDGEHECPDGNTCCKLASGDWGCCPLAKAVCCSDHLHCCPHGTKCDVAEGKCIQGDIVTNWFEKTPALKKGDSSVGSVVCPDGEHECPDGNTCCKLASGDWGCCPLAKAVCCSDHLHCCPHGTKCDVSEGKCIQGNIVTDWFEKTPALRKDNLSVGSVVCPDGEHECPDGNTCCKLASGDWGCCPLAKAVCCSDHLHCCPHGTKCDVSEGKCIQGNVVTDWFEKTPALKKGDSSVGSVVCPDGEHECPDGNTCCKLASGDWGCCPLEKAVCCSDHLHCCPHGTKCDVSEGKCIQGNITTDWFEKSLATLRVGSDVQCGQSPSGYYGYCPENNTCCLVAEEMWGCCPLENAVCCNDKLHCCPSGTQCDSTGGKCVKGDLRIDWILKQPVVYKDKPIQIVLCPGGLYECPDEYTCCPMTSGQWGCCPVPQAVCCDDHIHCCLHGMTCDVAVGKCIEGNSITDWLKKVPASKRDNVLIENVRRRLGVSDVICPDGSCCEDGETCCRMSESQDHKYKTYGCCPLPDAVCCSDGEHCCPEGTYCDMVRKVCVEEGTKFHFPWFFTHKPRSTPAAMVKPTPSLPLTSVTCPDGSECPVGKSCCGQEIGQFGCCPFSSGVCCLDGLHCCPQDSVCDPVKRTCIAMDTSAQTDWFPVQSSKTSSSMVNSVDTSVQGVICPDKKSQCPTGDTCCLLSDQTYGCCPYPHAVCCDGKKYCCPHGYICDTEPGICRIPEKSASVSGFLKALLVNTQKRRQNP